MIDRNRVRRTFTLWLALSAAIVSPALAGASRPAGESALLGLVPAMEGWTLAEQPRVFQPELLYEHIDGAAESYIAYGFKELVVAQFQKAGAETSLSVEIYDMGSGTNAFGIFSAERFPENRTVEVGLLGYIEGETLNYFAGTDYVKLLCYDGGDETETHLDRFGRAIAGKIGDKGVLPAPLTAFPKQGLIANSEKYIRKNVMGFEFLNNGYTASYAVDGREFECFLVDTDKDQDPAALLKRLLDFHTKDAAPAETIAGGFHLKNRYGQHMFLGVQGRFLFGVIRVPEGAVDGGMAYLGLMADALKKSGL